MCTDDINNNIRVKLSYKYRCVRFTLTYKQKLYSEPKPVVDSLPSTEEGRPQRSTRL